MHWPMGWLNSLSWQRLLVLCLLVSFAAPPALARRGGVVPIGVRIVGYVGTVPEGIRPQATWRLRDRKGELELRIIELRIRAGAVLPGDIDSALSPYGYRLLLTGDRESLDRLRAVEAGQQVVIDGYLRLQATGQYLMVSRVETAQHGHGQDQVTVSAAGIDIAQDVVSDVPDEVGDGVQLGLVHIRSRLRIRSAMIEGRLFLLGSADAARGLATSQRLPLHKTGTGPGAIGFLRLLIGGGRRVAVQ